MTDMLGFALVGCGDIGATDAAAIAGAPAARLVRVVDTDGGARRAAADRFGVPGSAALVDALEDPAVDAVFIATPHDLHAPMVIEAAQAGRHVIVEKPIATDVADAESAIAACNAGGVRFAVCHPRRYEPKIACARAAVEDGLLGRLRLSTSCFLKEKPGAYWRAAPWRGCRSRSGGGVLIMNLVHHIDALQVITDTPITSAVGLCSNRGEEYDVEDAAAVAIRYRTGALGTMAACSDLPGPKVFEDRILGEDGRLVVEKRSVRCLPHHRSASWTVTEFDDDRTSRTLFVEAFASAVLASRPTPVPASYGLAILRLVLQVYDTPRSIAAGSETAPTGSVPDP